MYGEAGTCEGAEASGCSATRDGRDGAKDDFGPVLVVAEVDPVHDRLHQGESMTAVPWGGRDPAPASPISNRDLQLAGDQPARSDPHRAAGRATVSVIDDVRCGLVNGRDDVVSVIQGPSQRVEPTPYSTPHQRGRRGIGRELDTQHLGLASSAPPASMGTGLFANLLAHPFRVPVVTRLTRGGVE